MNTLRHLLGILNKQEKKHLKTYLDAFHGKKENKLIELMELVEKSPEITQADAAQKLYGDPKSKAFIMTKNRLIGRIQETLLDMVGNPNNPASEEDAVSYQLLNIHKILTISYIIHLRGLKPVAHELLEETISQTKIIPFAPLRLLILEHIRMTMDTDLDKVQQLNEEIEQTQQAAISDSLAAGIMKITQSLSRSKTYNRQNFELYLSQKVEELERIKNTHYSIFSEYIEWIHRKILADLKTDVVQQELCLTNQQRMIEKYPLLGNNDRNASLYFEKSKIYLGKYDWETAIEYADKAMVLYQKKSPNEMATLLVSALAHFYNGNIHEIEYTQKWYSQQTIKIVLDNSFYLKFIMLCKLFLEKSYKNFVNYSQNIEELLQNKDHWNTSVRILEIMFLIDLDMTDLAISKLEALRKHLAKHDPSPQHQEIYKILHLLELQHFSFQTAATRLRHAVGEFRSQNAWEPISFEMIRIDVWVESHIQQLDYQELFLQTIQKEKQLLH